ncbi:MAG: NERD domain-containing protein [Alphaproteobacteria bacterium]|nr:NERD domain-containing protein [Alphaproteobacteria bacterium]
MKKNWRRHLLVGIIVALMFFGWFLRGFLWMNWRFRLFSAHSWGYVLHEFKSGWMLDALSDWIFLFTICSAGPCFLYLWYLCAKVRWRALVKKLLKKIIYIIWIPILWLQGKKAKKTTKKEVVQNNTVVNVVATTTAKPASNRPRAMTVQNKGGVTTPQYTPKSTFKMPQTAMGGASGYGRGMSDAFDMPTMPDMDNESYAADISQIPLEDIHLPERKAVIEDLDAIWVERNYSVIKNVSLGKEQMDYVAVNKDTIFVGLLDKEQFDWLADEESYNNEEPLWFSEASHRVSPIFILNRAVQVLKERLGVLCKDFTIKPLLIEQKGNIINAPDMMKSWLEMGVIVCRTDIGGPDDLSLFGDFLKAGEPVDTEVFENVKSVVLGEENNNG